VLTTVPFRPETIHAGQTPVSPEHAGALAERQENQRLAREEAQRTKDLRKAGRQNVKGTGLRQRLLGGKPEPPVLRELRMEMKLAMEARAPKGTEFEFPATPLTDYGVSQNVMVTPKDAPIIFDRDVTIKFPEEIRQRAGISGEKVGLDGLAFMEPGQGERYYLMEHKHVDGMWERLRYVKRETAEAEMKKMLIRQRTVAEFLSPWCKGVFYSTNNHELAQFLTDMILQVEPTGPTRFLYAPGS
jgi:hypothetical protein